MNELTKRVIVAAIGIPAAVLLIMLGNIYFNLAIIFFGLFASSEFNNLISHKTEKNSGWIVTLFTFIFLMNFFLINQPLQLLFNLLITFGLLVITTLSMQLNKGITDAVLSISSTIGGVLYIGIGFSSMILLRDFNLLLLFWKDLFNTESLFYTIDFATDSTWGLMILFIFISIWSCDSAAYFIGKSFGKNKLLPDVSPKKTKEGAYAGLAGAVISFSALGYFFIPDLPVWLGILTGIVIGVIGQVGDLAESLLKRDTGVKDSSNILPGHGGILDRFDSALFVFPTVLILFLLIAYF